jgi:TIR domain
MFVFISWSGQKSRRVAEALRDWLPCVINQVEPFMSSEDIYAGARWQNEIAGQLAKSDAGIVCVTRSNQHSPWLNFEAGALAKIVEHSRVIPVAIDLEPVEIEQPLGQFQGQTIGQDGIRSLVASINQVAEFGLGPDLFERSFSKWWPDLASRLTTIAGEQDPDQKTGPRTAIPSHRSAEDMMAEILAAIRALDDGFGMPLARVEQSPFGDVLRVMDLDPQASEFLAAHGLRYGGIVAWLCNKTLDMSLTEISDSLNESPNVVRQRLVDVERKIRSDPQVADFLSTLRRALLRSM